MATVKLDFNAWIETVKALPDDQKYAILAIIAGVIMLIIAIIMW
jgi:hypothetical protein